MATGDALSEQSARNRETLGIEPCPDEPCGFCTGDSAVVKSRTVEGNPVYLTSWEWCQRFKACAATIDWDKVFHGR